MAVMIGIDPHKGSHTAVAVDRAENKLGQLRVRATPAQVDQLRRWAAVWPERTWAVEGAPGLGRLLGQQLVAAGERVLDVQPKLAARVRLLHTGNTGKSDPNDALSVAVAALRSTANREVAADDHATVLKVWAKRHRDLSGLTTRSPAGCTRCCASWSPVGFPRRSPQAGLERSSPRSGPQARPARRAVSSPPSCWPTCAIWTASGAR